jgi:hypothetical protein
MQQAPFARESPCLGDSPAPSAADASRDGRGTTAENGDQMTSFGPVASGPADPADVVESTSADIPDDAVRSAIRLALGATGLALVAIHTLLQHSAHPVGSAAAQPSMQATSIPPPTQTLQRLATGTVGVGIEMQRRCLDVAAAIGGPVITTLSAVVEVATTRGPGAAMANRLGRVSHRGLAQQRRNEQITRSSGQAAVRAVVAAVLAEVDLDAVVARVDLDAVVARVDLDAAVARVDLEAIVDRLDIDGIAARLDLDAVAARLDVDAVVDRVDLQRLTNDVIDNVDIDAIAARLDLDAIAARLDVDAIVDRVDLARVTQQVLDEVDVGLIVRESSGAMAAETVDAVRYQGMRADRFLSRVVDRVLQRAEGRDTSPTMMPGVVSMNRP